VPALSLSCAIRRSGATAIGSPAYKQAGPGRRHHNN
jgi:hypothetical protein